MEIQSVIPILRRPRGLILDNSMDIPLEEGALTRDPRLPPALSTQERSALRDRGRILIGNLMERPADIKIICPELEDVLERLAGAR